MSDFLSDLGWIDYPRINFHGQFRASVSSNNNSRIGYTHASEYSFEKYKDEYYGKNWGPWGDGGWSFEKCKVVNAFTENAVQDTALINSTVNPADNKIVGRLVDIDVDNQGISTIYGFKINITATRHLMDDDLKIPDISRIRTGKDFILKAKYEPSAFQNMWGRGNGGMGAYSANYISVLTDCEFGDFDAGVYPAMDELRAYASRNLNQLSIRFVADAYCRNIEDPETFNSGRVYGVIGVYRITHPRRSLKYGRVCIVGGGQMVIIKYDEDTQVLYLDLGNAIPVVRGDKELTPTLTEPLGWPANLDVGQITLWSKTGEEKDDIQVPGVVVEVDQYHKEQTEGNVYDFDSNLASNFNPEEWINNSGIYRFENVDMTGIDYKNVPFYVNFAAANIDDSPEAEKGYFFQGEQMQIRLGTSGEYALYGNTVESKIYISKFGIPVNTASMEQLFVSTPAVIPSGDFTDWNVDPYLPTLEDCDTSGTFLQIVDGFYCITITAPQTLILDGKIPRVDLYLNSLLYSIKCELVEDNSVAGYFGYVLVFDESTPLPAIASWQPDLWSDDNDDDWQLVLDNMFGGTFTPYIRPIFRQYANLYPVMRKILNLDNYQDVTTKLSALLRAFNSDFYSAHYMPVQRDLSGQMVRFINSWLMNPIVSPLFIDESSEIGGFEGVIKDVEVLKIFLQMAIELELSTLPPYLSALYSIDPNSTTNKEIIGIIRMIVHQEMSHMALACNLLRSIDGTPDIASRGVVRRTSYPRTGLIAEDSNSLGIKVLPDIELALMPYSDPALEIFMKLEAPTAYDYLDETVADTENAEEDAAGTSFAEKAVKGVKALAGSHFAEKAMKAVHDVKAFAGISSAENAVKAVKSMRTRSIYKAKPLRNATPAAIAREKKREKIIKKRIRFKPFKASPRQIVEEKKDEEKENGLEKSAGIISLKEMEAILDVVSPVTKSDVPSIGPTGAAEYSIGAFYELIRKGFRYLTDYGTNNDIFVDTKDEAIDSQLGPSDMEGVTPVYDLTTALQAIETIVTEGEGTSFTDLWAEGDSLSHFHRFLELRVRHPILGVSYNEDGEFEYEFADEIEIPFNADDVSSESTAWDWLKPGGSQENADDHRVIRFNENYGRLLISLQSILGEGDITQLGEAIAIMRQMQVDFNDCVRPPTFRSGQLSIAPNWVPPTSLIGIL